MLGLSARTVELNFPTPEEANQDRSNLYSDQAILYFDIDMGNDNQLKIVSLNCIKRNGPNGFFTGDWENTSQCKQRYLKIANALARAAQHNFADMIVLQNTTVDLMLKILTDRLGNCWSIVPAENDDPSMLIAYRNITLSSSETITSTHPAQGWQSFTTQFTCDDHPFTLYNIDRPISPSIDETAGLFTQLLNTSEHTTLILGNLGVSLAPTHNHTTNISTGLMPLDSTNQQQPSFHQGGFILDQDNHLSQLDFSLICFDSGTPAHMPSFHLANYDFRFILNVDHLSPGEQDDITYFNNQTLANYQTFLRTEFACENIAVGFAVNANNECRLAAQFPANFPHFSTITNQLTSDVELNETDQYHFLYIFEDQDLELHHAIINTIPRQIILQWIDERIRILERAKGIIMRKGTAKANELRELKNQINQHPNGVDSAGLLGIIKAWESESAPDDEELGERTRKDLMRERRLRLRRRMPSGNVDDVSTESDTILELQQILNRIDSTPKGEALRELEPITHPGKWTRFKSAFQRSGDQKTLVVRSLAESLRNIPEDTPEAVLQTINQWKTDQAPDVSTGKAGTADDEPVAVTNETCVSLQRSFFRKQFGDDEATPTRSRRIIDGLVARLGQPS